MITEIRIIRTEDDDWDLIVDGKMMAPADHLNQTWEEILEFLGELDP